MPRVRYKYNPQPTRDEMKIMIKQQLLQVTMLLNQLGEAYRHINDLEELLQKKKEEDEVMNGLFEKKEEEEEEKKEGASRCAAFPGEKRNTDQGAGREVPTS